MRKTLLATLAGLLAVAVLTPTSVFAQEDEENDDRDVRVERSEDGRVIIIEEDQDGDRPRVERRIRISPHGRDIERHGEIIFRNRDGEERRFQFDGDGMNWLSHGDGIVTDTTIDGNRVIIIRTPDGDEEVIELDGMEGHNFHFEMPDFDVPHFEFEDFNMEFPDGDHMRFFLDREGPRIRSFGVSPEMDILRHFESMMGASEETRREMMELERRSAELAAQLREQESAERERELDETLERLFELRGQARVERAEHMEERAEEIRRQAEELRQSIRERESNRRALIEDRKRDLLGRGSDW